jgi:hypothetical protein
MFPTLPDVVAALQAGPLDAFDSPLGRLLVTIVLLAVAITVGRVVLNVAWRILVVVGMVVALLFVASVVGVF